MTPRRLGDIVMKALDRVTLLEWARFYQTLGFSALPKRTGHKYPSIDWKLYQARIPTDAELAHWFTNGADGVCLVLDGTGVVVLDCDGSRTQAQRLLSDAGIVIPHACPRVVTGRDCDHFYFRTERPVGRHVALLTADHVAIDVLGAGVVVVPPSVHPDTGRCYDWKPPFLDRSQIPMLPERVHELIAESQRPTQLGLAPVDGPILEGERERTLTKILGAARRQGAQQAELRALAEATNARCRPSLADGDLDRLARSIARYEPDDLDVPALIASVQRQPPERAGRRIVTLGVASAIKPRPVLWAWESRVAVGTLALVAGREGIGKSLVAYTLAADLTRGRLSGVYAGHPRSVIVAATEDSWAHTIVPRLIAADADLDRVHPVGVTTNGIDTELSLPRDLVGLARVTAEVQAAAIILDPLLSRLDRVLDTHKDAEVRLALEPLVKLAHEREVCVLGLIHVNKSSSTDPLTLLMGSRAFAAVARSVLYVMVDPEDETRRLLGQPKNNLGRVDLPTLAFQINGVCVAETDEGQVRTGHLEWLGETDRSILEAVGAATGTDDDRSATSDASAWLEDYLTVAEGRQDVAILLQEGRRAGHSKNALYRAKKRLRLTSVSEGFPRRACWTLPSVVSCAGESGTTGITGTTGTTAGAVSPSSPSCPSYPSFPTSPRACQTTAGDHPQRTPEEEDRMVTERGPPVVHDNAGD